MNDLFIVALIVLAFVLGYAIAWIMQVKKNQKSMLESEKSVLNNFVKKELFDEARKSQEDKANQIIELSRDNASQLQIIDNLEQSLKEDKQNLEKLQQQFKIEFENLAQKIFTQNSEAMTKSSTEKLEAIIKPFSEKMNSFDQSVRETYIKGTKERSGLQKEIEQLLRTNLQMSEDATRLTQALKGDSQFQGSWGEIQLKGLLEKSGLIEDVHFTSQESFRNDDGEILRTDFIIKLPDNKHLILDSKVSLTAFEGYYNAESEDEKQAYLKAHIKSISNHIKGLSEKNYQNLGALNPPDYVLLFMPLEPAFIVAVQEDPKLYEKALEKNIAIVSPSTLMATLRTISYIWKNENQTKNVMEIARQGAALYDKFVGFLEDMETLGKRIDGAQKEFGKAMNKLSESSKKGDTIIGRVESLKKLGANPTKEIDKGKYDL